MRVCSPSVWIVPPRELELFKIDLFFYFLAQQPPERKRSRNDCHQKTFLGDKREIKGN
jgi:hypothetical protein